MVGVEQPRVRKRDRGLPLKPKPAMPLAVEKDQLVKFAWQQTPQHRVEFPSPGQGYLADVLQLGAPRPGIVIDVRTRYSGEETAEMFQTAPIVRSDRRSEVTFDPPAEIGVSQPLQKSLPVSKDLLRSLKENMSHSIATSCLRPRGSVSANPLLALLRDNVGPVRIRFLEIPCGILIEIFANALAILQ